MHAELAELDFVLQRRDLLSFQIDFMQHRLRSDNILGVFVQSLQLAASIGSELLAPAIGNIEISFLTI